jgi:hypothetical protein
VLFPQLVMVLFLPFAHARGAVAGFVVALVFRVAFGEQSFGVNPFFGLTTENIPFRTLCMLSSMFTIFAVSWMYKERSVEISNLEKVNV